MRVLPPTEAEEAVQEALMRAWLRRDACRCPDAPLPWLLEITRNEARRQLGRQARRRGRELAVAGVFAPAGDDDPVAGMPARLEVERALDALADADRRVLRLRYAEDLSQSEVARRLGMREGTVRVRLHRARRRLRRELDEGG